MLKKVVSWFSGFFKEKQMESSIEERVAYLSSVERMNLATKTAFQELQKPNAFKGNHPDGNEIEIRGECSQVDILLTNKYQKVCSEQLSDLNSHHARATSDISSQLVGLGSQGAEADVKAYIASMSVPLENAKQRVEVTRRALDIFKGSNDITWEAEFPDSSKAAVISIGIAMVLEAIANIIFLRQGTSTINAIGIAILAAVLNVFVTAFLGTIYRWKNHHDKAERTKGYAALFGAVGFVIFLNSLIAFYRIHIAGEADSTSLTSSFYLESFLLYFVGMALGMYAFNKGYRIDDTYPGYGQVYRNWLFATEDHEALVSQFREDASVIPKRIDEKLISLRDGINASTKQIEQILNDVSKNCSAWSAHRKILNHAYKALISSYRGIAKSHIDSSKVGLPEYFNEEVDLGSNVLLDEVEQAIDKFNNAHSARVKLTIANINKINESRDELLNWKAHDMQPLIESAL